MGALSSLGCAGLLVFPIAIVAYLIAIPFFIVVWIAGAFWPIEIPEPAHDDEPSGESPAPVPSSRGEP